MRDARGAVAVDLGAGSGRFAAGVVRDGRIAFEVIKQVPHAPREHDGLLVWDLDLLLDLCREAVAYADAHFDQATLGIDAWGVDHGFLDADGTLIRPPVCYRDLSHAAAAERLRPHRDRLYELTGIQYQPFNTLYQLAARSAEDPTLPGRSEWLMLPDLLGALLSGERFHEITEASTTQLLGLDNRWCPEAFELIGWPVPERQPGLPGGEPGPRVGERTRLVRVASHDTASALVGFGAPVADRLYVNVGTWSLAMVPWPKPMNTVDARAQNVTSERTADGGVRLTKNIAGFWVLNRLHEELQPGGSVPEWLADAGGYDGPVLDLMHESLFNPSSMVAACAELLDRRPESSAEWAKLALGSLAQAIADQPASYRALTGIAPTEVRMGGGGSKSRALCQAVADRSGLPVVAGPAEATVLGNLAVQFAAAGAGSFEIADSDGCVRYNPG